MSRARLLPSTSLILTWRPRHNWSGTGVPKTFLSLITHGPGSSLGLGGDSLSHNVDFLEGTLELLRGTSCCELPGESDQTREYHNER